MLSSAPAAPRVEKLRVGNRDGACAGSAPGLVSFEQVARIHPCSVGGNDNDIKWYVLVQWHVHGIVIIDMPTTHGVMTYIDTMTFT